jgi:hypothetical protein
MGIEFDVSAVTDRLENMLQRLDHFRTIDIGDVLSDWQVQDMHRRRPFTMRSRARGRATTIIRPHSLRELKRSEAYQRRMGRVVRRVRLGKASKRSVLVYMRWEPHTSTRPILRSSLQQGLIDRYAEAAQEKLSWSD